MVKELPGRLQSGQKFRLRPTTNSRIYVVRGLVLKISVENGFKWGTRPSEDYGKILVPVDNHPAGELLIAKDCEVYLVK